MSLSASLSAHVASPQGPQPDLTQPAPSWLANYLERRLAAEQGKAASLPLPQGVRLDLRPQLPPVGIAALMLYTHRRQVDSFPLPFTTLALAHPN